MPGCVPVLTARKTTNVGGSFNSSKLAGDVAWLLCIGCSSEAVAV